MVCILRMKFFLMLNGILSSGKIAILRTAVFKKHVGIMPLLKIAFLQIVFLTAWNVAKQT